MARNITTINQLWEEWTVGLNGQPSIEELDRSYGPAWRPGNTERQYYGRRRVIISEIRRRAALGETFVAVVDALERERLTSGASLDKIGKGLKKIAAERTG